MLEKYLRCKKINIINEIGEVPQAYFHEEEVAFIPGEETVRKDTDLFLAELKDPNAILELRHPETDEVIGEAIDAQIHVIMYSLYKRESKKNAENKALSS